MMNCSSNSFKQLQTSMSSSFNTSSLKSKSPARSNTPTPTTPRAGDRFIPLRSASNFELGNFKLHQQPTPEDASPNSRKNLRGMYELLNGVDLDKQRILVYQNKVPNPNRILYTPTKTLTSVKNNSRYIPQVPDCILSAPDLSDNYYLNIVDWSCKNIVALALGAKVCIWHPGIKKSGELLELQGNDYVCSLGWSQNGDQLAIGTALGTVELWDCAQAKRVRVMDEHSRRVGALSWYSDILSSGSISGQIIQHDVRQHHHNVSVLSAHKEAVCGLKWSTDGQYLASGGNDNVINIWPTADGSHRSQLQPLYSLTSHQAAVKALAWCPWQPRILASGGGAADRHIRFWNCNTGACVNSIDTKSQVCGLLWSSTYKEIASGHGYSSNQITIWKYPSMTKVADLKDHGARVLNLALSPDGTTVLSAAADEKLRFWKCFIGKDASLIKAKKSIFSQSIR